MRIVVTGASGFLGAHLVTSLRAAGSDVIGVARRAAPGVELVSDYAAAPGGDVLIHLAQDGDRRRVNEAPTVEIDAALATVEDLAARFGRVVYASSAAVYGDAGSTPSRVGDATIAIDSYTQLKQQSEAVVIGRGGVVARLANLYGPGMSPTTIVGTLLAQSADIGPVRVWDDTPVRDFLWVEDAAAALASMSAGSAAGVFNVGTGIGTSVRELALRMIDVLGQSGRQVVATAAERRHSYLVLDIDETARTLAWRPETSLSEGLVRLVRTGIGDYE